MVAPSMLAHVRSASGDLLLSSLLIGVLSLALPVALLHVYDRVLASSGISTFNMLAIGVTVAMALETLLRIARSSIVARAGAAWEAKAHASAMDRLAHTPIHRFERSGSGAYLERLASIVTVRDAYLGAAFQTLLDLPFCALYVAAMLHLSPLLAAVPVAMALVFLLASLAVARLVRRAVVALSDREERRFNMLFDVLSAIHSIKALGLEAQMTRRYERLQQGCADARGVLAEVSGQGQALAMLLSNLATALVATLGCLAVLDGELTVGGLGACLLLTGRTMQPLGGALGVFARAEVLKGAQARLADIESMPDQRVAGAPALAVPQGRVALERLRLTRFDGGVVLDEVTLAVEPGECVGIRAANGTGKTSLLQLIQGTVRPTSGRVLIDGQDLARVDPRTVAESIAYLPAHGTLVRGTLLDNLTMYRPALAARARAIAAELGLDVIAATLPQGYETPLADGTTNLSRGAAQIVAIARALVGQPRILLFDEANIHLDAAADQALRALLTRLAGHCTIILVSDRPSMLSLARRQLRLRGGRLEAPS
jgi:ATP-binding cassette, subfamily C, bacterial LapB